MRKLAFEQLVKKETENVTNYVADLTNYVQARIEESDLTNPEEIRLEKRKLYKSLYTQKPLAAKGNLVLLRFPCLNDKVVLPDKIDDISYQKLIRSFSSRYGILNSEGEFQTAITGQKYKLAGKTPSHSVLTLFTVLQKQSLVIKSSTDERLKTTNL